MSVSFMSVLSQSVHTYSGTTTTPTLEGYLEWVTKNPPTMTQGPREGTVTEKIFTYCDTHKGTPRKDVVTTLVGMGLNPYTVMTQYQRWLKTQGTR